MRKVLVATEFIRLHFPEVFLNGEQELTLTDALKMRTIFTKNVDQVEKMTAEILESIHNNESFKETIAVYEKAAAVEAGGYINPAQKASSFRSALRLHLEENLADYMGPGDFALFGGKVVTPHADLTIMRNGLPHVAIETRPAKRGVQVREIYELLGVCGLRLKPVAKNWIICDPSWTRYLQQIEKCRSDVSLKELSVGIFDPDSSRPQVSWSDSRQSFADKN